MIIFSRENSKQLTSEFEMKDGGGRQKWHLTPAGKAQATRCVTLQVAFYLRRQIH
jgi:hypothetical protein